MGVDFIDFTALEKRGLLKKQVTEEINEDKTIDFTGNSLPIINQQTRENNQLASINPIAGFFSGESNFNNQEVKNQLMNEGNEDIKSLKIKIDDLEFKLDNLLKRFEDIEKR